MNQSRLIYLTDLKEPLLGLKRSVPVFIEEEGAAVVASNEELGIYACGETVDEALEEFRKALVSDYEFYGRGDPADMTEGARKLSEMLRGLIDEILPTSFSANLGQLVFWEGGLRVDTATRG
jgi:hypothetical protein